MAEEPRIEELDKLIAKGKQKGFLTYDEVNDALPSDVVSLDQLDDIMMMFGSMDIELVDSAKPVRLPSEIETPAEPEDDEGDRRIDLTPGPVGRTEDPVRLYLRKMGSVSLLTREGEVEIAKRIEEGEKEVIRALLASRLAVADILDMGNRLRSGKLRIREVVRTPPRSRRPRVSRRSRARVPTVSPRPSSTRASSTASSKLQADRTHPQARRGGGRAGGGALQQEEAQRDQAQGAEAGDPRRPHQDDGGAGGDAAEQEADRPHRAQPQGADRAGGEGRGRAPGAGADAGRPDEGAPAAAPRGAGEPRHPEEAAPPAERHRRAAGGHRPRRPHRGAEDQAGGGGGQPPGELLAGTTRSSGRGAQGGAGQGRAGGGQPPPGGLHRQEVHQPRAAVPGPDPGREHRPDEGGGQVRVQARVQVLAPTPPGGSARPSPAPSPIRRAPSASRST